eukprot:2677737-Ditylum_brightwellii.AAC.1
MIANLDPPNPPWPSTLDNTVATLQDISFSSPMIKHKATAHLQVNALSDTPVKNNNVSPSLEELGLEMKEIAAKSAAFDKKILHGLHQLNHQYHFHPILSELLSTVPRAEHIHPAVNALSPVIDPCFCYATAVLVTTEEVGPGPWSNHAVPSAPPLPPFCTNTLGNEIFNCNAATSQSEDILYMLKLQENQFLTPPACFQLPPVLELSHPPPDPNPLQLQ